MRMVVDGWACVVVRIPPRREIRELRAILFIVNAVMVVAVVAIGERGVAGDAAGETVEGVADRGIVLEAVGNGDAQHDGDREIAECGVSDGVGDHRAQNIWEPVAREHHR